MSDATTQHTPADVRERAVRLLGLAMERLDTVRGLIGDALAALRSEAQGEDRWEDLVFGPITKAYNEAHAAHRSDAQKGDADALDLIRWAESRHAALEPVAGNIMPPGTYACYAGDGDEPYMGPGILGAIRAARRGEGGGK